MLLQRYILRELLATFVAAFAALTAVIFVGMALVQLQALKYFPISAIGEIAPYFLPLTLSFALPVAVLISCALVFGRLSADNEIDAIRVAGISLRRVLAPPLLLGILASVATLHLNQETVPKSHFARRKVTQRGIQEAFYNLNREASSVPIGDIALAWSRRRGEVFQDFQIRKMDPKTGLVVMEARASEGRLYRDPSGANLWIDLVDGTLVEYTDPARRDAINPGTFREYREVIDLSSLMGGYSTRLSDMTNEDLEEGIRTGGIYGYPAKRLLEELYRRRAMGFAPLVFALFGTPLGILVRKGSRLVGLGTSTLCGFLVYYPLMTAGEALAVRGRISPEIGLWGPDALMALAALVLLRIVLRK